MKKINWNCLPPAREDGLTYSDLIGRKTEDYSDMSDDVFEPDDAVEWAGIGPVIR